MVMIIWDYISQCAKTPEIVIYWVFLRIKYNDYEYMAPTVGVEPTTN